MKKPSSRHTCPTVPTQAHLWEGVMRQGVKIQHELVNNANDKVSPLLNEPVGIQPENAPSQIRSEANELVSCGLRNRALQVARRFESSSTRPRSSIQLEREVLPEQLFDRSEFAPRMGVISLNSVWLHSRSRIAFVLATWEETSASVPSFASCEPPLHTALFPWPSRGRFRTGVAGPCALDILPSKSIPRGHTRL